MKSKKAVAPFYTLVGSKNAFRRARKVNLEEGLLKMFVKMLSLLKVWSGPVMVRFKPRIQTGGSVQRRGVGPTTLERFKQSTDRSDFYLF